MTDLSCSYTFDDIRAGLRYSTVQVSPMKSPFLPCVAFAASMFIETIETRQGLKVSCPEEIAFSLGYISAEQVEQQAKRLGNTEYARYLLSVVRPG